MSTGSIGGGWALLQEAERGRADAGRRRPQRRDHVGPEGRRVVVARVQGQPGGGGVALGRGTAASHSTSSVVLPKPAGADTSISSAASPWCSRSRSRGRGTSPRRGRGGTAWSRAADQPYLRVRLGAGAQRRLGRTCRPTSGSTTTSWAAARPSATSGASSGTLRLTRASAIGPSSWWRAEPPTRPTTLPACGHVGADAGSRFSEPSRWSSVSRRGGRPRVCTRATVSWPR